MPTVRARAGDRRCGDDVPRPPAEPVGSARYEVEVHAPARLQGLRTTLHDVNGVPVSVSCDTCHAQDPDGMPPGLPALDTFHTGMVFRHGALTCGSCHDPEQRDSLRLADGTTLAMVDAIDLCGQCHGPQRRDYTHGSHGGAAGYWDLSRGARTRNHCVDCHDPHAPQFPTFDPMPAPRDRFLGLHDGAHR